MVGQRGSNAEECSSVAVGWS